MKRRYLCVAVSFMAAGILSFDISVKVFWTLFSLMALVGLFLFVKNKKVYILILSLMFLFGGLYGNYTQNVYKTSPLFKYTKTSCNGRMFVKDIDLKAHNYVTVNAVVTEVNGEKINENVLFTIYDISDVKVNSVIYFDDLTFKIPDRERNRGGFNYNRYLKSNGIYFTAAASRQELRASGSDGFVVLQKLRTFKQQLSYRSEKVFNDRYAAQIMPAILVGNDTLIDEEVDDLFKEAGITHILVASGMHVTVVMLFCAFLLYPLRRVRLIYNLLSCLCIVVFGGIVGGHPSIIRAIVAFFMYFVAKNTLRSADNITVLFEAALVILLINPLNIYNLSFLLSFGAVFGILVFTDHIKRRIKWCICVPVWLISLIELLPEKVATVIKHAVLGIVDATISAMSVSLAAQIGVLPIMLGVFKSATLLSVFINVLISFATPFLYIFGILAFVFNIQPFVWLTEFLCNLFVKGAYITAVTPGNKMSVAPTYTIIIMAVLIVLFCLLRCKKKWFEKLFEPLFYLCIIIAFLNSAFYGLLPEDKADITFLNVEQGDCAVIRLSNRKTVIIDTGTERMCANEVVRFLEREGIGTVSALILSHSDSDHSGGAKLLNESINIEKVITNRYFKEDDIKFSVLGKDDVFYIENAKFTVLSPGNSEYSDENESSLVVRMDFGESSFLFTGDIGKETEECLENVDVDVLKVSHHGSKSSSSEEFLKRVSPAFSVISVGKDNKYGHPDEDVLKRLKESGSEILRTDKDFTITFDIDLKGKLSLTKGL